MTSQQPHAEASSYTYVRIASSSVQCCGSGGRTAVCSLSYPLNPSLDLLPQPQLNMHVQTISNNEAMNNDNVDQIATLYSLVDKWLGEAQKGISVEGHTQGAVVGRVFVVSPVFVRHACLLRVIAMQQIRIHGLDVYITNCSGLHIYTVHAYICIFAYMYVRVCIQVPMNRAI